MSDSGCMPAAFGGMLLHDYAITGIDVDPGRQKMRLQLCDPAGVDAGRLEFNHVCRAQVEGWALQNIILELSVFTDVRTSFEYRRVCSMLGLDPAVPGIFASGGCMVLLEASAGAEIALLLSQPWSAAPLAS